MRFMESTPLAESQVELGSRLTSLCGDAANPLRSEGFQPKPTPISVVKEPIQSPGIHLSAAGPTGLPPSKLDLRCRNGHPIQVGRPVVYRSTD